VRLLEKILLAGQKFSNGIHVSRLVECQLKMRNVHGDQHQKNRRAENVKKIENSSMKTVAEQSMSSQTPLESVYGVCQEI
jgi:hypothetical protein